MIEFQRRSEDLLSWLFDSALPLWWQVGGDRIKGGFHEKLSLAGEPVRLPHRARVIARQAFSYCEAGRLGWNGPWREAAVHALDYLGHFITSDRTVASLVGLENEILDPTFDLYNQAFALLAFAHGHGAIGIRTVWRENAIALRQTLQHHYAHPHGGYYESRDGKLPLRSNPHMHLLESALSWMEIDDDPGWRVMADDIVNLCLGRFIDSESGALREFFAADWKPASGIEGRLVEPGHQYEWAYLLSWWARLTGNAPPASVARLVAFADAYGIDRERGVAVNSVLIDGTVHDRAARLWPQTERIRAYVCSRPERIEDLVAAMKGLCRYFETEISGLWYDCLTADNTFVPEPSPASSLYHIVGAVSALHKLPKRSLADARPPRDDACDRMRTPQSTC